MKVELNLFNIILIVVEYISFFVAVGAFLKGYFVIGCISAVVMLVSFCINVVKLLKR